MVNPKCQKQTFVKRACIIFGKRSEKQKHRCDFGVTRTYKLTFMILNIACKGVIINQYIVLVLNRPYIGYYIVLAILPFLPILPCPWFPEAEARAACRQGPRDEVVSCESRSLGLQLPQIYQKVQKIYKRRTRMYKTLVPTCTTDITTM